MGEAYEFNGELYNNSEEFLDAIAHEYKAGDKDLALQALNDFGFDLTDINVRPDELS